MIYYTGDIHGDKREIVRFAKRMNLTADDMIVILGDVGALNLIPRDRRYLSQVPNGS